MPRLILAILIAIVISKPLELKLFEKEINQQIIFDQQQKSIDYQILVGQEFDEIVKLEEENIRLRNEISIKEEQRNSLFSLIIAEAEGRSPTKLVGKGSVYNEKKLEYDKVDNELKNLRLINNEQIAINSSQIQSLKKQRDNLLHNSSITNRNADGFLARLEAIGTLTANNNRLMIANLFIILLFICIECAPIIMKIMSARGPYDELIEAEEYLKLIEVSKLIAKAEITEDQKFDFHQLLIREKNEILLDVEKEKITNQAKAEKEINRLKVQNWKKDELDKITQNETANTESNLEINELNSKRSIFDESQFEDIKDQSLIVYKAEIQNDIYQDFEIKSPNTKE